MWGEILAPAVSGQQFEEPEPNQRRALAPRRLASPAGWGVAIRWLTGDPRLGRLRLITAVASRSAKYRGSLPTPDRLQRDTQTKHWKAAMDNNEIAGHVDRAADAAKEQIAKATDTFTQVAGRARAAAGTIRDTTMEAGKQVGGVATKAYQQGAQAADQLSHSAAEQPLLALLIAGAIGYAVAYLIHTR
jgi:uncharacterized protein YjbJ (UPF0337 family)